MYFKQLGRLSYNHSKPLFIYLFFSKLFRIASHKIVHAVWAHFFFNYPNKDTWMQSQNRQNDLSSFPRQAFNIIVIQVYALTNKVEEAEVE